MLVNFEKQLSFICQKKEGFEQHEHVNKHGRQEIYLKATLNSKFNKKSKWRRKKQLIRVKDRLVTV